MDLYDWRSHMWTSADKLQHITPDEVPNAMVGIDWKDGIAKIVAESTAEDAKYILRLDDDDVFAALTDYVKQRWPDLF